MLSDIKCPYCNTSILFSTFMPPLTDTFKCSQCSRFMQLGITSIGFLWMLMFVEITAPIAFIGLGISNIIGKDFLIFSFMPWKEILLICFLGIPGGLLVAGPVSLRYLIGTIVKVVAWWEKGTGGKRGRT
jgi:hypothetical protein